MVSSPGLSEFAAALARCAVDTGQVNAEGVGLLVASG
jgi:hypothetical protein